MSVLKSKSEPLRSSGKEYSFAFTGLLAAIVCLVIMLPSILRFGGVFYIRGDYIDQFVGNAIVLRRLFFSGLSSWNWTAFLGEAYGAFSGNFSYDLLCLLFPENLIPQALTYINILRFSVAAMTAHCYFSRFVKDSKNAVIGGLLYAFSSYCIVNTEFMQFMNTVSVFPLLLIAAEDKFVSGKNKYLLIFAAFINACSSFYFFIGTTLIFCVYFLIRFFGKDWKKNRTAKNFFVCVFEYVLGFVLSCFNTVPIMIKILMSSKASSALENSVGNKQLLLEFVYTFANRVTAFFTAGASNRFLTFFGNSSWMSIAAYLPLFGSCLLIPFLLKEKKNWKKTLLVSLLVISFVPWLNNFMTLNTSTYTRWWYALVLVLALVTVTVLDNFDSYSRKELNKGVWVSFAVTAVTVILNFGAKYAYNYVSDAYKKSFRYFFRYLSGYQVYARFAIYSAVVTLFFLLIVWLLIRFEKVRKNTLGILLVCIMIYGSSFNVINNSVEYANDYTKLSVDEMADLYYNTDEALKVKDFAYRVEYPHDASNYSVSINASSPTVFSSYTNSYSSEFAYYAGMCFGNDPSHVHKQPGTTLSKSYTGNPALRALLSIKYYYDYTPEDKSDVPVCFSYLSTVDGVDVNENRNFYIPYGFSYDTYMTESEFKEMFESGKITAEDTARKMLCTLVVDDEDVDKLENLLDHEADKDMIAYLAVQERLKNTCTDFVGTNNGFTAKIKTDEPGIIFFSIPYAEGWSAYVNYQKAQIINANIGFMAIKVPSGESEISFEFRDSGAYTGMKLSVIALAVTAAYVACNEFYAKKRKTEK